MKEISNLSKIGNAIKDFIDEYDKAVKSGYVFKPISYALYHTWKIWDEKEKIRDISGKDDEQT